MSSTMLSSVMKTIRALLLMLALSCAAQAQTFTVLHTFKGGPKDGQSPFGQVALDSAGNIYGTTQAGGTGKCQTYGCGIAFRLNKRGEEVYSFDGADGSDIEAGLTINKRQDVAYGTAVLGGDTTCYSLGCGTVFKLSASGKETVLHEFTGSADGSTPLGPVTQDAAGNLYGVTEFGGDLISGYGTIYKVDSLGNESVLYSFTGGSDGCFPAGGLLLDAAGNLYGTASGGCTGSYYGDIFELSPAGDLSVLYTFGGGDGTEPSSLIFGAAGNLYGVTVEGGSSDVCNGGCGTVFELLPNGNGSWSERVLYNFCSLESCADGQRPYSVILDGAGNLYGAAADGGGRDDGVVFQLDAAGKETVLHSFTGGADGAEPTALTLDLAGNLYGTAVGGGDADCFPPNGCGVVFKLVP